VTAAGSVTDVPAREDAPPIAPTKRKAPRVVGALVLLAAAVVTVGWVRTRGHESTDDAQIEGHVLSVASRVSGQVLRVHVKDNQEVAAGDVLVELDPADFAARRDLARAELAAARAQLDGARFGLALTEKTAPAHATQASGGLAAALSGVSSATAGVRQAEADLEAARARRALAVRDHDRAASLATEGSIAPAEVDGRRTARDAAEAHVAQAEARLAAATAAAAGSTGGVVVARGRLTAADTAAEQVAAARASLALAAARVAQAEAQLTLAERNLGYTTVRAAQAGVVSRRSVEEGQVALPERPLLALVSLHDVWVVANFKEDQISGIRAGQVAEVKVDAFGAHSVRAHVESLAAGTGSRFALLPPDNATGNFVKVVQRVPVLLRLDGEHGLALRPGMSAEVSVDTRLR
jgi:membrane fusion protein (multidrug efflux system)